MSEFKLTTVEEFEGATNRLLETGAKVGADPATAEDPTQWGIAVLGPNTKVADEEIVPAKTMLDKTHQGVEA